MTLVLNPIPQKVLWSDALCELTRSQKILFVSSTHTDELVELAIKAQTIIWEQLRFRWSLHLGSLEHIQDTGLVLKVDSKANIPPQGYDLKIEASQVLLTSSDTAGIFYGLMTLQQVLRQTQNNPPQGHIEDHPDILVRGVMLDVSRCKVPKQDTLYMLIEELASLKINQLQLYTEHTFAYQNHETVWKDASPLTGEDLLLLGQHCRKHFIELVPNQNSFGHLTRWLKHPEYQHLAECEDGFEWPWGEVTKEPFSLNPTDPQSLELVSEWYDELLPYFQSQYLNVGCDETFDLGQGKSKEACKKKGKSTVYLNFLLKLHQQVKARKHTMMFWADILLESPEAFKKIPKDSVALIWGYEAKHPFDEQCKHLSKAPCEFYVCPGTSSWNSLSGRNQNALENLRSAAVSAKQHGASGYLITDWGDYGHWQYLPLSYWGFAAGAAVSWCVEQNQSFEHIADSLDMHVLHDPSHQIGQWLQEFGNLYQGLGQEMENASVLFRLFSKPHFRFLSEDVTIDNLKETLKKLKSLEDSLNMMSFHRQDEQLIRQELQNMVRMVHYALERGIGYRLGLLDDYSFQAQQNEQLRGILTNHSMLWVARNRRGGLEESLELMQKHKDGE